MLSKPIFYIVLIGFALRLAFIYLFAAEFFQTPNFYYQGDTGAWALGFENLIKTGEYTINPLHEDGYFGRMPGYSFYLGIFYFLNNQEWNYAFYYAGIFQVYLDLFSIILIYKITYLITKNTISANISAILYATYPFIIVWNPVCHSESLSVFFLLLSYYFYLKKDFRYNYFLSGMAISFGILVRPQLFIFFPILGLGILYSYFKKPKVFLRYSIQFLLAVFIFYGSWPVRNFVNHKKIVLTQKLDGLPNWDKDVRSFTHFMYSVQTDWEPQFTEIIKNKKVTYPSLAKFNSEDSLLLVNTFKMAQNCGWGFSNWRGYWKEPMQSKGCTNQISENFLHLRKVQIKSNPYDFWIKIPLQNLKKAIFKYRSISELVKSNKIVAIMFLYRSLLIFLGIYFLVSFLFHKKYKEMVLICGGFFAGLYFILCFGTAPMMRNIEMRYFLQPDILLLIPLSLGLAEIISMKNKKQEVKSLA